jgi:hypothetical protein
MGAGRLEVTRTPDSETMGVGVTVRSFGSAVRTLLVLVVLLEATAGTADQKPEDQMALRLVRGARL